MMAADDQHDRDRESYSRSGNGRDPSPNVQDLVRLAMERQDDLREMEAGHERYVAELRSAHAAELRAGETERINAIRAVDVGAAAILANQVAASAEALRGQVEAARQQTATALAAALEPIQKDIQDLRRAQYEAQGKTTQGGEARLNYATVLQFLGFIVVSIGVIYAIVRK
jgi:hypothetical protein